MSLRHDHSFLLPAAIAVMVFRILDILFSYLRFLISVDIEAVRWLMASYYSHASSMICLIIAIMAFNLSSQRMTHKVKRPLLGVGLFLIAIFPVNIQWVGGITVNESGDSAFRQRILEIYLEDNGTESSYPFLYAQHFRQAVPYRDVDGKYGIKLLFTKEGEDAAAKSTRIISVEPREIVFRVDGVKVVSASLVSQIDQPFIFMPLGFTERADAVEAAQSIRVGR